MSRNFIKLMKSYYLHTESLQVPSHRAKQKAKSMNIKELTTRIIENVRRHRFCYFFLLSVNLPETIFKIETSQVGHGG